MFSKEQKNVATLYDSSEGQLGPILFGGHMHWGYWDNNNCNDDFANGANRLTEIMISKTKINSGQYFADLGCGVGLAGIRLARAKNCKVEGVTISSFQQRSAMISVKKEGLLKQVNFIYGDACNLPYINHSFDGAWFFESIFHMGHQKALCEANRILKSGAILTLTDLPILKHTTNEFINFVYERIYSNFISKEEYPIVLKKCGFELLEIDDITDKVMPYLVNKLTAALNIYRDQIKEKVSDLETKITNWLYLFEYISKNLGYIIVTAKKI